MKTVLIIDDDQFITNVYQSRFRQEGYDAVCAHCAEDALQILETSRPALIMLDLNMPETNGVELLRHIRSQPELAKTPVVVLSHGYVQTLVDAVYELGITKFYTKAVSPPNTIIAELKKLLETLPDPLEEPPAKDKETASDEGQEKGGREDLSDSDLANELPVPLNGTTPLQQRKALIHLYRKIKSRLQSALSDPAGSQGESAGLVVQELINDLYQYPEKITIESVQSLMEGVENLNKVKPPTDLDPASTLAWLPQDEDG